MAKLLYSKALLVHVHLIAWPLRCRLRFTSLCVLGRSSLTLDGVSMAIAFVTFSFLAFVWDDITMFVQRSGALKDAQLSALVPSVLLLLGRQRECAKFHVAPGGVFTSLGMRT